MKAAEVTALITESAARFGDRSPQQIKYLSSRFGNVEEAELAQGLLQVFTHGAAPPDGAPAQELAGQLLAALGPKAKVDLGLVLRSILVRYELSVEQLPQYLASQFGVGPVLALLQTLEKEYLSEQESRALRTMRFWIGGAQGQNGA